MITVFHDVCYSINTMALTNFKIDGGMTSHKYYVGLIDGGMISHKYYVGFHFKLIKVFLHKLISLPKSHSSMSPYT